MKKVWKRILAFICAIVLVLGSGLTENTQRVEASDETTVTEYNYNIFSSEEGANITSSGNIYKDIWNANVNLPTTASKEM